MSVSIKSVTAGYHRTLAIPLNSGRYFGDDDRAGAEAVIILSDAAVRMFFAGDDPLGRVVVIAGADRRVVGVVTNARQSSLEVNPHPEVYLPMAQSPSRSGYLVLRTSGDPNDALPALRATVARVLPEEPLRYIARMDDLVAAQTAERRLNMLMFSLFGLLGLVISAVVSSASSPIWCPSRRGRSASAWHSARHAHASWPACSATPAARGHGARGRRPHGVVAFQRGRSIPVRPRRPGRSRLRRRHDAADGRCAHRHPAPGAACREDQSERGAAKRIGFKKGYSNSFFRYYLYRRLLFVSNATGEGEKGRPPSGSR